MPFADAAPKFLDGRRASILFKNLDVILQSCQQFVIRNDHYVLESMGQKPEIIALLRGREFCRSAGKNETPGTNDF